MFRVEEHISSVSMTMWTFNCGLCVTVELSECGIITEAWEHKEQPSWASKVILNRQQHYECM